MFATIFIMFLYLQQEPFWNIRCCNTAKSRQLNDYSLLSGYLCHSSFNAFKLTIYYADIVALLVCSIDLINEKNVLVVDACQLDEVVHRFFWDDERGILAIRFLVEVIVVEGYETEIGR